jgi:hypothetical protein
LAHRGPAAALGLAVAATTVGRWWAARAIPSPWFVPDEQIYAELGRSLYRNGHFEILGHSVPFYSLVYPALAGLPLSLSDRELGYELLKPLQALVMASAAVPVYLWGRSLMAARWTLVAAVLTLACPALVMSGFVMSEVAFYPVVVLAAWAMARMLEQPGRGRQALAVASVALGVATRLEAIVLLPALVLAIGLQLVLTRRRPRVAVRFAPALAGLVALAVAWRLANPGGSSSGGGNVLGAYHITGEVSYPVGPAARFIAYHAADLLLLTAVLPVVAVALLFVEASGRERSPAAAAYLAVTTSLCLGLVVEVGLFASRFVGRLFERGMTPLAPLLFLGFCLWLDRGAPRRVVATVAATAAALALLAFLPLDKVITQAAIPDAFSVVPLYRVRVAHPDVDLRVVLLAQALALVILLLVVGRRFLLLLPAAVLVVLVTVSVEASHTVAHQASGFRTLMAGPDPRWIDETAPGPVAFLYAGEQAWSGGAPPWVSLFWNRRLSALYVLGGTKVVGPIAQTHVHPTSAGRLLRADGRPIAPAYVVASIRYTFVGTRLATEPGPDLALWRTPAPLRLATRVSASTGR